MKKLSKEAEEVVYRRKRRVEGVICDICDRIVPPSKFKSKDSRYFEVMTGHHDWGNDSCESIQHLDICPNCINDFMTKYVDEINGTEYFELETEYVWENDYEYE